MFRFGAFQLDLPAARLWCGEVALCLTPKAFDVLHYLVAHPGELVTKDELWRAVWPNVIVTDAALTVCMSEVRKALGDEAKAPRYIATVHRRGYRFIAPVRGPAPVSRRRNAPGLIVGRDLELAQLRAHLDRALGGERQIVFISGEPGIGKTSLIETLLAQSTSATDLWVGRGQCVEHSGAAEAYLPVLDALSRLARGPQGERLLALLAQSAPSWLAQMPSLLSADDAASLQSRVGGTSRDRMLRELAEAVEVITRVAPLVLWLEDLHWSDHATLDWLAFLARRDEPARLLLLGTYRPVELILTEHPLRSLKQELRAHRRCEELPLSLLSAAAVESYLAARLDAEPVTRGGDACPAREGLRNLASVIHQRTDGNPLFMVNIVDYLRAQSLIPVEVGPASLPNEATVSAAIPDGLHQMITRQFERLATPDQQLLETASIAGVEFSAATLAAGLDAPLPEVEARCAVLARGERFLRTCGITEWPDGTVATRYGFIHALYREVIYNRVPAGTAAGWHRLIAAREVAAFGPRANEIAPELALHWTRGRDYARAAQYCLLAGDNAMRRSAYLDAIEQFRRGLELLVKSSDAPARDSCELALRLALGPALIATLGNAAAEVEACYVRAGEVCESLGEHAQLFQVLFGLRSAALTRGELRKADAYGERLLALALRQQDRGLLLEAYLALGNTAFQLGELQRARTYLAQGIALYEPALHQTHAVSYGMDPGMFCLSLMALVLQLLGYPAQARARSVEALALAANVAHPYTSAMAANFAAWFHQTRREPALTESHAERAIELAARHGFVSAKLLAGMRRAWALGERGEHAAGIVQLQAGIAEWRNSGAVLAHPHFLGMLATAYARNGQYEDALAALSEALQATEQTDERWLQGDLCRLQGELLLATQAVAPAETVLLRAIEYAREQRARLWQLRAALVLSRHWRQQGQCAQAYTVLHEILDEFDEGFDTPDLAEAETLLQALSAPRTDA